MWYRVPAQTFPLITGGPIMHAYDHPRLCRLKSPLLVSVYHTLSRHQDATLAKQRSAAGQNPERGLLWVPPLDKHVQSRRRRGAGGTRRRADVDGCMPRPLAFGEVVWTEFGEFATNCRKASEKNNALKKKELEIKKKSPNVRIVTCVHGVTSWVPKDILGISGDMCSSG